jgi:hypothetical protein
MQAMQGGRGEGKGKKSRLGAKAIPFPVDISRRLGTKLRRKSGGLETREAFHRT